MKTVQLYSFTLRLNGLTYCGQIPAHSFEEAEGIVGNFGGKVDGQLAEEQALVVCAICGGNIVRDLRNPQPVSEEWPEELI